VSIDELILMAEDQSQVLDALHEMLVDLRAVARPERVHEIEQRRDAVARRLDDLDQRILAG
jgi:hypothetical protein